MSVHILLCPLNQYNYIQVTVKGFNNIFNVLLYMYNYIGIVLSIEIWLFVTKTRE